MLFKHVLKNNSTLTIKKSLKTYQSIFETLGTGQIKNYPS
mgnify:CR=1 FL=1